MNFKVHCRLRYRRLLSPYLDGELDEASTRRVNRHLQECAWCRAACDDISFAARAVSTVPMPKQTPAPIGFRGRLPAARPPRSRFARLVLNPITAAALMLVVLGGVWSYTRWSVPDWKVVRLEGAPRIGPQRVTQTGILTEGEWLETDQTSRARVTIGRIGQVEVSPNTRVQLVNTRVTQQRLSLAKGRLEATIWAPPRLFVVDTPSAEAVDLGCAYSIEVDDSGRGMLRVTSGWVALVLNGRESKVPAGAVCATRPKIGPGTPCFEDAPGPLREALEELDFEGGGVDALDLVLADARVRDTLTLYHLLARVDEADRGRVYDRLAAYNPPPEGVTREGISRLDVDMLETWRRALEPIWLKESMPTLRKAWRWIWS